MNPRTEPVISRIESMVADVPGWSPIDQLYTLFNLAYLSAGVEGDLVEVGCWCGRSTSVLALAAQLTGNTRVHGIDLFPERSDWKPNPDGSYRMEVTVGDRVFRAHQEQTVWKKAFREQTSRIYETWASPEDCLRQNLRKHDLEGMVTLHRGTTETFAELKEPGFRCRMAFIDGDHGYQAVCRDIRALDPFLSDGGWICFDDAFSSYEGVNRAVTELIINNPEYELGQQMTRKAFVARKRGGR